MKKFVKSAMFAHLLALALSFTACQKEDAPVVERNTEDTITANSDAANLMTNIASNDGSFDNIVDGSSCFDILFPYNVSVNGLDITINAAEDLQLIEEIIDILDADNDILEIVFPITITLDDYTELTLENLEQLRGLALECIEGGGDADIECIDVIYPVTFFTYDINQQQTGAFDVESDREMRRFFAGLDAEDFISIQFPVLFETYDGEKITANSINELTEVIELAKEACDEDDDSDHNDDDFTKEILDGLLVECPWLVKEVKRENQYNLEQYENDVLNFHEDGIVTLKDSEGNLLYGEWATRIADFRVLLNLEFESLNDFNLEWFVYDIDGDRIRFYASDGDKIMLKTTCGEDPEVCDSDFIKETIATCRWVVADDDGSSLAGFNIDFSNGDIHVRDVYGEIQDEGHWSIDGEVLIIKDLTRILANYIGEWTVVECATDRFKIKRDEEYLTIEKECE